MPLKADFHVHTAEDPEDPCELTAHELIDAARGLGYGVLAVTNHNVVTFDEGLRRYAADRGILLLPGTELSVCGRRHVLVINSPLRGDRLDERVGTLADLAALKDEGTLIIAPHPFHRAPVCLGRLLEEHVALFDAVESSHFSSSRLNLNRRAEAFARRHGLPLVGTSDAHFRFQFGRSYTLVDAERDAAGVVAAVRAGRVECVNPPLSLPRMGRILLEMTVRGCARRLAGVRRGGGRRTGARRQ
ncbi:MAG: PHP domain-containing protein [bacterium]|nr:PHP domain-containing protein [bacterium]